MGLWIARIFFTLVVLGVLAALVVAGVAGLYVWRLSRDLPEYAVLRDYQPKVMTRIHTGDGTIMAEYAAERRIFVPIQSIPRHVTNAFISAEDKTFYEHDGLDYKGIVRAAWSNVSNYMNGRRLEGASTITQQVAKNFLLSGEVRLERKVKEALLAQRIEDTFTKDQILELYLNEIYLGWRSYGVAAAALNYFDKSLDELTIAEAAYLASMPKAPNNYRPDRVRARARGIARRNWVLARMAVNGHITERQMVEAQAEELVVYDRPFGAQTKEYEYFSEEVRRQVADLFGDDSLYHGGLSVRTTLEPRLQHAAVQALRKGLVEFDQRQGYRGPVGRIDVSGSWSKAMAEVVGAQTFALDVAPWLGAVVLDVRDGDGYAVVGLQDGKTQAFMPLSAMSWARRAEGLTQGGYHQLGPEIGRPSDVVTAGDLVYVEPIEGGEAGGTPQVALRQIPEANGGIIAMDPHTGRVYAMHGGFSFDLSEFNRASQAMRQPGSSFKPFVYAAALDNGYTPSSLIVPTIVTERAEGASEAWKPDNYAHDVVRQTTLRRGFERSSNLVTINIARDIGISTVINYAQRMGVVDTVPEVNAIALGTAETTLMRMVTAYSMFVNSGRRVTPILIDQVQDRTGRSIFRTDQRRCESCRGIPWEGQDHPTLEDIREQVLDSHTAYQVTSLLEGVVQRGTGRKVSEVGVPLAGKTGTTQEERDAWFVGFAPDLAVGVFVGYDTPRPMGRRETGSGLAAPIFKDFMAMALEGQAAIPFRVPPGMVLIRVNAKTGQPPEVIEGPVILEAFKPGTGPSPEDAEEWIRLHSSRDADGKSTVERGSGGLY